MLSSFLTFTFFTFTTLLTLSTFTSFPTFPLLANASIITDDNSLYSSLSVNRLSYCTTSEINRFSCTDCNTNRSLIGVYDPASKASSQVVVVLDNDEEEILVSFRGTINNVQQWASDLDTVYTKWYGSGKVHRGFYDRFNEIKSPTLTFLKKAQQQLPDGDIVISGHSMGGAVATLFASYLKDFMKITPDYIYTYGSPRVGDGTFAKYIDKQFGDRIVRVMNEWDMVSDLPPMILDYRHTGKLVLCKTGTSTCAEKNRLDENPGGIVMAIKRTIETAGDVKKCHLTYLDKTIGTNRYKCV
jgi:hypothetical protein